MKKFWKDIVITILTAAVILLTYTLINIKANLYAETMMVLEVNHEEDTITLVDINDTSNIWEIKGSEDWEMGDFCSCLIDSKGTETVKDDVIISVRYKPIRI